MAATIRKKNGYASDCGLNTLRARKHLREGDYPALVLWPGDETAERRNGVVRCSMAVRVEAFTELQEDETDASQVCEALTGDLITCFAGMAASATIQVDDIWRSSVGPLYPDDNNPAIAGATIELTVQYRTLAGNPASQIF